MEILTGVSWGKGVERELCVQRRDGEIYFWIRSPGSQTNGWDILVSREELLKKLVVDPAK